MANTRSIPYQYSTRFKCSYWTLSDPRKGKPHTKFPNSEFIGLVANGKGKVYQSRVNDICQVPSQVGRKDLLSPS